MVGFKFKFFLYMVFVNIKFWMNFWVKFFYWFVYRMIIFFWFVWVIILIKFCLLFLIFFILFCYFFVGSKVLDLFFKLIGVFIIDFLIRCVVCIVCWFDIEKIVNVFFFFIKFLNFNDVFFFYFRVYIYIYWLLL